MFIRAGRPPPPRVGKRRWNLEINPKLIINVSDQELFEATKVNIVAFYIGLSSIIM